jgi:hypothetical protein
VRAPFLWVGGPRDTTARCVRIKTGLGNGFMKPMVLPEGLGRSFGALSTRTRELSDKLNRAQGSVEIEKPFVFACVCLCLFVRYTSPHSIFIHHDCIVRCYFVVPFTLPPLTSSVVSTG